MQPREFMDVGMRNGRNKYSVGLFDWVAPPRPLPDEAVRPATIDIS
jgi:hypothetical protein